MERPIKGGYILISLGLIALSTSYSGSIDYDKISRTKKHIVLTGIKVGDTVMPDICVKPVYGNDTITFEDVYGYDVVVKSDNTVEVSVHTSLNINGDINATGKITGGEIVENMSGYSFTKGTTDKGTLEYVYVGMVKNGNKLTIVNAFTFQRNENSTGGFYAGRFIMPNSVASKIIPFIKNIVATAKVQAINDINDQVTLDISFVKNGSISLDTSVREINTLDITKTYYIRVEATFLLSENLVSE